MNSSSSSIQFLKDSDFSVDQSGILNVNISSFNSGYSLILFYSTQCPHCKEMLEAVRRMPSIINGCSFGVINLDHNKGIIQKCAKSQLQLKYVPFLVFFASGVPYMVYNGPTEENEIKRFIIQVSEAYHKEYQNAMPPTPPQNQMNQQQGRASGGIMTGNQGQQPGGGGMGGIRSQPGNGGMGGMGGSRGQAGGGMPSSRPAGGAKPNLDLACSLDDMACLEHSVKKYSGCYVSMQEAYTNKIGK